MCDLYQGAASQITIIAHDPKGKANQTTFMTIVGTAVGHAAHRRCHPLLQLPNEALTVVTSSTLNSGVCFLLFVLSKALI